jgi:hypothetical protein
MRLEPQRVLIPVFCSVADTVGEFTAVVNRPGLGKLGLPAKGPSSLPDASDEFAGGPDATVCPGRGSDKRSRRKLGT